MEEVFDKNSILDSHPHYVFVQKDKHGFAIFSKFRIPFDKTKHAIINNLKNDIIQSIKLLDSDNKTILLARYGTTRKQGFYDIENILFYNIGTTHFNSLTKNGLMFSTVTSKELTNLHKKYNIPSDYYHYYEYSIIDSPKRVNFGYTLAKWKNISLKLSGLKTASVWLSFKQNKDLIEIFDKIDTYNGENFAIVLEIEKPRNIPLNLMTSLKPLLDGLICSFHSNEFDDNELEYFSKKLNCHTDTLLDNEKNVLGYRSSKYLQIYRNNIRWNPADEFCNQVIIKVREGRCWNLSGTLYSNMECPYCGKKKIARLLYGLPRMTDELQQKINELKIKLAGCLIDDNNPNYYCNWCKKTF